METILHLGDRALKRKMDHTENLRFPKEVPILPGKWSPPCVLLFQ